jgi:beta-glucosidase-like glycosyl hydrolase
VAFRKRGARRCSLRHVFLSTDQWQASLTGLLIMQSWLTNVHSYGCQNSKALNGLLKDELGFQGYVMSDWAATHSGVAAIEAGLVSVFA